MLRGQTEMLGTQESCLCWDNYVRKMFRLPLYLPMMMAQCLRSTTQLPTSITMSLLHFSPRSALCPELRNLSQARVLCHLKVAEIHISVDCIFCCFLPMCWWRIDRSFLTENCDFLYTPTFLLTAPHISDSFIFGHPFYTCILKKRGECIFQVKNIR